MDEHCGLWAIQKKIPKIKKDLRALVQPLNYIDVRRHRLSIYDAISCELLEDGFTECDNHFKRLTEKENYLYDVRIIKTRVYESKGLLEAIIDNARIAERNCKLSKNYGLALKALFQTAMLLDRREGNEYNWLTKEMFLIINDLLDKWSIVNDVIEGECKSKYAPIVKKFPEIECRSRYFFGKFLLLKNQDYIQAIEELKIALELAKGKLWYTAKESYNYLSLKTRIYLCKAYLCEAARVSKKNKSLAEELASQAIASLWEGRLPKDVKLFCEANLRKGFYSIGLKNYEKTLTLYSKVQPYIYSLMLPEFKCELFLHQGICYLNLDNDVLALRKLKQAIRLGEIYKIKTFHAHALLQIGKLYSKSYNTYKLSHISYLNARDIYTQLDDENNVKKVNYLAAKLKSMHILPQLVKLIEDADTDFCEKLKLNAWKDYIEIFWKDEYENQKEDSTVFSKENEKDFNREISHLESTKKMSIQLLVMVGQYKVEEQTEDQRNTQSETTLKDDTESNVPHKCIIRRMPN